MNSNAYINRIALVAALGGLLFGFDTAIISGTIPYIKTYFQLDDASLGWAVSSILIGCATGAILAGNLADLYSRRYLLFICAMLFAISGIGAGLSHTLTTFVFFRLLGGLGVGAAAMISPLYIAETAPAALRGRLVSLYQLAILTGIMLAYLVNYFLDGLGENNWRWMFASQAAPSLLFFLLLFLVPETPRWLVSKNQPEKALRILTRIEGQFKAKTALALIKANFDDDKAGTRDLLNRTYRRVLLTGIIVAVLQQVTGINAILYYAPAIFRQTGIDTSSALLQTIGIGAINMLATLLAIGWIDKVGRKKFLLYGSGLMCISLIAIGICFRYQFFDYYLVLLFMLLYVAAFGCTLGAVTWVYLSEIFPNRIRALAMSLATLALWLADFVVTYTFPVFSGALGTAQTLFVYAAFCLAALIYFRFFIPETKGKTLEEIETLFL